MLSKAAVRNSKKEIVIETAVRISSTIIIFLIFALPY